MKLVLTDDYLPGVFVEGGVVDIDSLVGKDIMGLPGPLRMSAIIADWNQLSSVIASGVSVGVSRKTFQIRAPRPQNMLFAASNYNEQLENPILAPLDMFLKSPATIADPNQMVILPPEDAQLFFHEAELGVVIGRVASRVSEENAMQYVFGYTCVNDVSSWGLQGAVGGINNKNFKTFCPLGPCITTLDEIGDPHNLDVQLSIDGKLRQTYNTSDMEHRIPALIAWASQRFVLQPGDLLACGTNHFGIGPIQDGNVMRLEIGGIGVLENPVQDELKRRWPDGPDKHFVAWVHRYKTTGEMTEPMFSVSPEAD